MAAGCGLIQMPHIKKIVLVVKHSGLFALKCSSYVAKLQQQNAKGIVILNSSNQLFLSS
jgi:hypothetical protein